MNAVHPVVVMAVIFVAGVAVFELLDRAWQRWAPNRVKRVAETAKFYYLYPFRWVIPDVVYKLWLRTGIMSPESYRVFQTHGFIRDDVDPKDIQQYEPREDTSTVDK